MKINLFNNFDPDRDVQPSGRRQAKGFILDIALGGKRKEKLYIWEKNQTKKI